MLFLQSIMFYLPHVIYKSFEGGKIKVRKRNYGSGAAETTSAPQYLR